MPRGTNGEKRPADVIGNAVHVMRIGTGEAEEDRRTSPGRAKGGRAASRRSNVPRLTKRPLPPDGSSAVILNSSAISASIASAAPSIGP